MQNYRPISVLPAFSKMLEKLMYNRLLTFLKKHRMLTEIQHGFIGNKSTETASQSFIESVHEALDNQRKAIGIFLDLSKAYDVINHKTLLDKLDLYGVLLLLLLLLSLFTFHRSNFGYINQGI